MSRLFIPLMPLFVLLSLAACTPRMSSKVTTDIQKNGLVVRLHDYQQRMDYLRQKGFTERYEEEKAKVDAYNREVVRLFRTEFDFCPVYFFYSSQTDAVYRKEPVLLADDLNVDPDITYPSTVFVADYFDLLEQSSVFGRPKFQVLNTKIAIAPSRKFLRFRDEDVLIADDVRKFNNAFKYGRALYKSDLQYFLRKH